MSNTAISKFLTGLAVHFPPKHARPELETEWLKSMSDALRGYPADVLDAAAKRIVHTRKYTSFPLPAECRAACMDAANAFESYRRAETLPTMRWEAGEWTRERRRLAYELVQTNMGKEAARGGWVQSLWNFCRREQRLPKDAREIEQVKAVARETQALEESLERVVAGPYPQNLAGRNVLQVQVSCLSFAQTFANKRKEIEAVALGGPIPRLDQ